MPTYAELLEENLELRRMVAAEQELIAAQQRRIEELEREGVEATNWPAEHALRAAVINRKSCGGGNRTAAGAHTQEVLMSLLRTGHLKGIDPLTCLTALQQNPRPVAYKPLLT